MIGDIFALASAACFAAANITIARGAPRSEDDNGAFLSLLLTAAISAVAWIAFGVARGFVPITLEALLWFAGGGVFTGFIGRVFLFASVQRLGAMRASAIKRLNPLFAVVLGVVVLGEAIGPGMAIGMTLIVASFAILVRGGMRPAEDHRAGSATGTATLLNAGYVYGPLSALGYATGYLFRKMGLVESPDALLGTMVGAIVGAAFFVLAATFRPRYASAVRSTLGGSNRWLVAAGVTSSFGQIFYFFALESSPMSRVALIVSMEVFVTLALAALFLRKRESLTPAIAAAAVLGVAGTACIVLA